MNTLDIWPVIHLDSVDLALHNAQMAVELGAAGVFLIHMDGQDDLVDHIGSHLRQAIPSLKIGVNYLSLGALDGLKRSLACGWGATWSDRPGVRSDGISEGAQQVSELLRRHPEHQYFGSIAFKYQPIDLNPAEAALRALDLGMIPTTSGAATGQAPTENKLAVIRDKIGQRSLAVASGITPENIGALGRHLTHVLVSTGIGEDFYRFDRDKLRRLMQSPKECDTNTSP